MTREPLNKFDMAATAALWDGMQGARRRAWLFHSQARATQQTARKVLSRQGCAPIGPSRRQAPWYRSDGYDRCRLPGDHPDWGSNTAHGRLVQRFPSFLVAPDAFKGSLTATEAAAAIAAGIHQAVADAEIYCQPLADGGEGTLTVLLPQLQGSEVSFRDENNTWHYGIYQDEHAETVALIESASLIGLTLPWMRQASVEGRSSAVLGRAITHALTRGIRRFVIGLGGTATNDGGIGMLSALGMRCTDTAGKCVAPTLSGLMDVAAVDLSAMDQRLFASRFTVLSDVFNPLCGSDGATAVFGPQKGLTGREVARVDTAMHHWSRLCEAAFGRRAADVSGAGAAGGLGFALLLLGGKICSGADYVMAKTGFRERVCQADWVITGEGRSDMQTLNGKLPLKVAEQGRKAGCRTALLSGAIEQAARVSLSRHFDVLKAAAPSTMTPNAAMRQATGLLQQAAAELAGDL